MSSRTDSISIGVLLLSFVMGLMKKYLKRSQEIIGERTTEEEQYDNEVVKWLRIYEDIRKALDKANKKYPNEALLYDDLTIDDIELHYDYLVGYIDIIEALKLQNSPYTYEST